MGVPYRHYSRQLQREVFMRFIRKLDTSQQEQSFSMIGFRKPKEDFPSVDHGTN